jgi:predicted small lipoprotein YifL
MTRSSRTRAVAACAALGIALGACGHYGPPVRPKPQPVANDVGRESEAHPADQDEKPEHHEP